MVPIFLATKCKEIFRHCASIVEKAEDKKVSDVSGDQFNSINIRYLNVGFLLSHNLKRWKQVWRKA